MTGQITLFQEPEKEDQLTIGQAAQLLGISRATAGNWLKAGRLRALHNAEGRQYFSRQETLALLERIRLGEEGKLRRRRNKTQVAGHLLQQDYVADPATLKTVTEILDRLEAIETELQEPLDKALTLRLVLAEYALKRLAAKDFLPGLAAPEKSLPAGETDSPLAAGGPSAESLPLCSADAGEGKDFFLDSLLKEFFKGRLDLGRYEPLIRDLFEKIMPLNEAVLESLEPALSVPAFSGEEDDLLGLLYLALNPLNHRKKEGVYYTPMAVTRDLVDSLWRRGLLKENPKVWDPACGSGNFLLAIYQKTGSLEELYGSDTDELSIALARINLALASGTGDIQGLMERLRREDSLYRGPAVFDLVIGNPPWGQKLTPRQQGYLRRTYVTAAGRRQIESFAVFAELALKTCRAGGTIALVLPEALLQAESHGRLRQLLEEQSSPRRLRLWGNIFQGIQCPALTVEAVRADSAFSLKGVEIVNRGHSYVIEEEREDKADFWKLTMEDADFRLLQEISGRRPVFTLAGQADFALGIVTGDNDRFLSEEPAKGREPIWTGAQVFSYHLDEPRYYIDFDRRRMQQAAPEYLYRARQKLIYRFICRIPVFAWDQESRLTLNSANVLIPKVKGYSKKYILAVLNSRPLRFFFLQSFPTLKVLKRHIESLPIPAADRNIQRQLDRQVNRMLTEKDAARRRQIYERIDRKVMELYGLTQEECRRIREGLAERELFLL